MYFLNRMPNGRDLHHHLTGAVHAESYIDYAVGDGVCIQQATKRIVPLPCDAAQAVSNFTFRNQAIEAWAIGSISCCELRRKFIPILTDVEIRERVGRSEGLSFARLRETCSRST